MMCRFTARICMLLLLLALCSCGPFGVIPLLGAAAGGGGGGGGGDDGPPPETFSVVSIDPPDEDTNVDIYSFVTATFSEPVNRSTVSGVTFRVAGGGAVSGNYYFFDNDTKVRFAANPSLPVITDITVSIVSIESGVTPGKYVAPFSSTFTTAGSSTAPPQVTEVVPPHATTLPLQTYMPVRVLFSRPMSTAAGATGVNDSTFYIYHVSSGVSLNGTVTASGDLREFEFTPTDALVAGQNYEVRVEGSVTSSPGGYSLGSLFSSSFTTVDLDPTAIIIPVNSPTNPAGWINGASKNSVTVRVGLNANVLPTDQVVARLIDGITVLEEKMAAGITGPGNVQFTGIDASGLLDGPIILEAIIFRGEFSSETTTGSADKDTVDPTISLFTPSPIPQYYELRNLELTINMDSNGDLHLAGGRTSQTISLTSGNQDVDYELNVAARNDIVIYATDNAGNESNQLTQTVYHRGGASGGPVTGSMQVTVYRESDLTAVPGAMVVCGYSTEVQYTDINGVATFEGVSGPQAVTVIVAGYPVFSVLDIDAARLSLPVLDESEETRFATVNGNVNPIPSSAMMHYNHEVHWDSEDQDVTDGDFSIRVSPNRPFTISVIDNTGAAFDNFAIKRNMGPLNNGEVVSGQVLYFPLTPLTATRRASGTLTLPPGILLPAKAPWIYYRPKCLVMSRSRAESERYMCGFGAFPVDEVGGGPFPYSSIQPGYFDTSTGEYWMMLGIMDINGREITCAKPFPPGGPFPDFVVPEPAALDKPGTAGVVTSLTPTFEWNDSNTNGLHMVQVVNLDNSTAWVLVVAGGVFNATLPSLPPSAPVKVMEFGDPLARLQWRVESMYFSSSLNLSEFCNNEMEFGQDYRVTSEWQDFNLWEPAITSGRVPVFGAAGEPDGTLTVTVIDFATDTPVPGAVVFVGDDGTDAASREITDAFGQAVFNGLSGPQKFTVCYAGYPYMTFNGLDCSYCTAPLMSDFDGATYTLYGEIVGLPDSESWVEIDDYYGQWFQPRDDPPVTDDVGHEAYTGPSPENYSLIAREEGKYEIVTGFYGVAVGDAIFDYAYYSDVFVVNPSGSPRFMQAPVIDYNEKSSLGFSPMPRVTDPSDLYLPANLAGSASVDYVNAKTEAVTTDNPDGEPVTVKIGLGETAVDGVDPDLYHYGVTFAIPNNFRLDSIDLTLDADGWDPDGTEWESNVKLGHLVAYPQRFNTTLPDIPYPVSPVNGDTGTGLPVTMEWQNTFQGKEGIYMIMFSRGGVSPFFWAIITPIPDTGATASFLVPALPVGFDGPEVGLAQEFQIEGTVIPGFDTSSWSGDIFEVYNRERARYEKAYFTP